AQRHHRRRAQLARERRHLAERATRPEATEDLLLPALALERNLGLAAEHDEHVGPRLELGHDAVPLAPASAPPRAGHVAERLGVERREERDATYDRQLLRGQRRHRAPRTVSHARRR